MAGYVIPKTERFLRTIQDVQGPYFFGQSGAGKSIAATTFMALFYAVKLWKLYTDRLPMPVFANVPFLINFGQTEQAEALWRSMVDADVLVLDDFGLEYATNWALTRLYTILDLYYRERRLVIFTSMFDLGDYLRTKATGDELRTSIGRRLRWLVGLEVKIPTRQDEPKGL